MRDSSPRETHLPCHVVPSPHWTEARRFRVTRLLRPRPRPSDRDHVLSSCRQDSSRAQPETVARAGLATRQRSAAKASRSTPVLDAEECVDICADCKTKHPRWASHNLGIFIWFVYTESLPSSLGGADGIDHPQFPASNALPFIERSEHT